MRRRLFLAFAFLIGAIALIGLWFGRASKQDAYGKEIPSQAVLDFTLTDQEGKPFSLSSLRGRFVLMTFGFTHCPNICPTTLGNFAAIYRALAPADQARLQVLFISVDPTRDTPAILKDYVPFFESRFVGLTGSIQEIAEVAKMYGAYYEIQPQTSSIASNYYTVNHSTYSYLIDPSGRWIALYAYEQLNNRARMAKDLHHFLSTNKRRS